METHTFFQRCSSLFHMKNSLVHCALIFSAQRTMIVKHWRIMGRWRFGDFILRVTGLDRI